MTAQLDHIPEKRNPYVDLISDQVFALISSLDLDSGHVLEKCEVAYKTWGVLNEKRDNVLVVCHALSGSSDLEDWWGPLLGPGKAFDYTRYLVFCGNLLGSPYGSASPLTINPSTGRPYGPEFPETSIRDDVRAHKLVLDAMGVQSVAAVVGGSMGGMSALEWPLCTPVGYVNTIIPIATSADHSAWGISWAEAQKQCIYADSNYQDGYYDMGSQPTKGLAAARMVALLTYRSGVSFDKRFGRKSPAKRKGLQKSKEDLADGHCGNGVNSNSQNPKCDAFRSRKRAQIEASNRTQTRTHRTRSPVFSAQGYLKYQGDKFIRRFDANCYINLTNKMDTHDLTRDRIVRGEETDEVEEAFTEVLKAVPAKALVVSVDTDNLFQPEQQVKLAKYLPDATLSIIRSEDGHDGFLLEFEALDGLISERLKQQCSWVYKDPPLLESNGTGSAAVKDSVFGEVESEW
ncbi:hypothetical protein HO133_007321 [Letharia lupina]|uniref:AB hydrolase-1 domain-containing protein n=1 Tax=Letharia lupina TaxID=560253 RepID=A0A8H6FIJ0_9LECA|nr:uncharacterized protein HO133_007321 [Letharia lupina]KAF6229205.1 hypothetical protein HO133_007321 [Letharia lupina]